MLQGLVHDASAAPGCRDHARSRQRLGCAAGGTPRSAALPSEHLVRCARRGSGAWNAARRRRCLARRLRPAGKGKAVAASGHRRRPRRRARLASAYPTSAQRKAPTCRPARLRACARTRAGQAPAAAPRASAAASRASRPRSKRAIRPRGASWRRRPRAPRRSVAASAAAARPRWPPRAHVGQPATCYATKFVHVSVNKVCSLSASTHRTHPALCPSCALSVAALMVSPRHAALWHR